MHWLYLRLPSSQYIFRSKNFQAKDRRVWFSLYLYTILCSTNRPFLEYRNTSCRWLSFSRGAWFPLMSCIISSSTHPTNKRFCFVPLRLQSIRKFHLAFFSLFGSMQALSTTFWGLFILDYKLRFCYNPRACSSTPNKPYLSAETDHSCSNIHKTRWLRDRWLE